MAQVCTQGDAGAHDGQTQNCLQGQPGEIKQRLHIAAVELHKGILGKREGGEKMK